MAVIFAAVTGAILWNYSTWWLGLPTSSSHALIGGLVGVTDQTDLLSTLARTIGIRNGSLPGNSRPAQPAVS